MRAPQKLVTRARELRRDMRLPEILLWDCLGSRKVDGLRFRRQHPIGPYVLDFYCPESHLAVEIDGAHHDLPGQMAKDDRRDSWLRDQGIRTLRIAATDTKRGSGTTRSVVEGAAALSVPAADRDNVESPIGDQQS